MTKPKILVALSTFAQYGEKPVELLKSSGLPFVLNSTGQRLNTDDILKLGQDCQGIIAGVEPYTKDVLSQLPNLRCISRCGVGIDSIDLAKAKELEIKILNTPNPVIVPVAELTVGMMLDLLRQITWHTVTLRNQKWQKKGGYNLQGKTVGIIGLGRIGKKVAQLLKSFSVDVIASDSYPDDLWAKENNIRMVSVEELLRNSDIVTLHLKTDKRFPFVLGEKEIRMMKSKAFLLNLARGEMVDENALYCALTQGHLAGAGLDVFSQEPYSGKLATLDNVLMTPHIATLTAESRLEMETQAVENLLTWFGS
ncbi:MAG: phosphoglycerate dehydrogenase [Candidatus Omnitrophica bacterium]|nr:phosphoglycerate dehydrogenase [Candidatus Omnitrophota bacterium]